MLRRGLAVALLALLTALASGCGGGDGREDRGETGTPLAAPREGCVAEEPEPGTLLLGTHAALIHEKAGRDRRIQVDLACRSGVSLVREDLRWDVVERRQGARDWRTFDAIVALAARRGLTVLPILDSTPAWAGPSSAALPRDPATAAAVVADVARRYGPGGRFWLAHPELPQRPTSYVELYNEIYFTDPDPAPYARAVAASAGALEATRTSVRLLVDVDECFVYDGQTHMGWLEGLYAADPAFGRHAGALSVHPYGKLDDPDRCHNPARLEDLHATLVAHGDGDIPLWVTEIGWSTCPDRPECVSEAVQAENLRRFLALARTRWSAYVKAVVVFRMRDWRPRQPDDAEPWYGVLGPRAAPKPAWSVLRRDARASSTKRSEASR